MLRGDVNGVCTGTQARMPVLLSGDAEDFADCSEEGAAVERLGEDTHRRSGLRRFARGVFAVAGHENHAEPRMCLLEQGC